MADEIPAATRSGHTLGRIGFRFHGAVATSLSVPFLISLLRGSDGQCLVRWRCRWNIGRPALDRARGLLFCAARAFLFNRRDS